MDGHDTPTEFQDSSDLGVDPPDRWKQLVEAASELLEENGLEGLTIRAVLKRTGLARRAFYERFSSKDELVLAVFEQTLREIAAMFRRESDTLPTPLDRMEAMVVGLARGANDSRMRGSSNRATAIVREHMRLGQTRPRQLQAAIQPFLDFIAELVTEGVRAGQLRPCNPVLQATLIYNLVATTLHTRLMTEDAASGSDVSQQELTDGIWEFCRRAIIA